MEEGDDGSVVVFDGSVEGGMVVGRWIDSRIGEEERDDLGVASLGCKLESEVKVGGWIDSGIGEEERNDLGVARLARCDNGMVSVARWIHAGVSEKETQCFHMAVVGHTHDRSVVVCGGIDSWVGEEEFAHLSVAQHGSPNYGLVVFGSRIHVRMGEKRRDNRRISHATGESDGSVAVVGGIAIASRKCNGNSSGPCGSDTKVDAGLGAVLSNVVWVFVAQSAKEGRVKVVGRQSEGEGGGGGEVEGEHDVVDEFRGEGFHRGKEVTTSVNDLANGTSLALVGWKVCGKGGKQEGGSDRWQNV